MTTTTPATTRSPSSSAARRGSQEPTILVAPEVADASDGDEAIELAGLLGIELDAWQRDLVRLVLGKDAGGRLAALTVAISVPRQNGKNTVLHVIEMYLLLMRRAKILHTAHRTDTARESFERLTSFFEEDSPFPQLTALVKGGPKHGIKRPDGKQEMELVTGAKIGWSVRSTNAKRGFAGISLVVLDEAQDLTEEALSAIKYTLSASKTTRQLVYAGTPPAPDMDGEEFTNIRRKLLAGETKGIYYGFGIESLGADPWATVADRDNWYLTNPAMGIRLTEEFTEEVELGNAHSPEEFARERLGWWPEAGVVNAAIPPRQWDACRAGADHARPGDGVTCYAVKFSVDGETATLAACVRPRDGGPSFVEAVENRTMRDGVSWLAGWLLARRDRASLVVVDGAAGAEPLLRRLAEGDGTHKGYKRGALCKPRARDVADACAMLANAVRERTVCHSAQPGLDEAIASTCKRVVGGSGGWAFGAARDGADATIPEAVALAHWACQTTKRDAGRVGRIG